MGSDRWSGWQLWARIFTFVATYVALMGLSYRIAWEPGTEAPLWWPSAGLAIGVLVRAPKRAWWPLMGTLGGVVLVCGLLGFPAPRHPPPLVAVLWTLSDLVPLLGASLLLRFGGRPFTLQRPREVLLLLVFGVISPALLSDAFDYLAWSVWPGARPPFGAWSSWWIDQALGTLCFAPLVLSWPVPKERVSLSTARLMEAVGLALSLVLVSLVAFELPSRGMQILALGFATSPLLAWAAIRFGARGAAMAAFLLAAMSISRTLAGRGPFVSADMLRYESMAYAIAYIALAAISSLLLAAFAMERRRADARQRLSLEATSILVQSAPLGDRLRQVVEMMVSAELARAAELRIGAAEFTSPPGHPPLQERQEQEVRVVPLEEEAGVLKLQAMPELGYFDDVDVRTSALLATRISHAVESDRLRGQIEVHARRNEETLALLDSVLRCAPVGIALVDLDRRFIRVNEALERINGVSRADHVGKRIAEVRPGKRGTALDAQLRKVIETGEPMIGAEFQGSSVAHPGELRTWMLTCYPIAMSGRPPLGVCCIIVDATERKRQEAELRTSEERFRHLAEEMAEILFTTDKRGIPSRGARRWAAFTGQSPEDYRSERWLDVVHPEDRDRVRQSMQEGLRTGTPVRLGLRLRHRDGTWRTVESFGVPLREPGGGIREMVGAMSDVTERTRAEEARERALSEAQEALRIREDFLSVASHELKTPLTPLAVRLEMMQRQLEAGQAIDPSSVAKARASLSRLTFLISDLLDVTRIQAGRLAAAREPVPLLEVVREVVDDYRASVPSHGFDVELPEQDLWLLGDRSRLVQVLDNLVDNAIKFSPKGGRISVSLHSVGGEALLSVSDEGIGIPPEDQARIFDRFYRARNASARSYGGLGLGLNITRNIVEHHGGRIWVESQVGRGSTFHVALPLMVGAEVAAQLH